jgi:hypothetical protein
MVAAETEAASIGTISPGRSKARDFLDDGLVDDLVSFFQHVIDLRAHSERLHGQPTYLVFVVRRAYILFRALLQEGLLSGVDANRVMSSRALDGEMGFLHQTSTRLFLVDDSVRSGSSLRRIVRRIRLKSRKHTDSSLSIHAFCYAAKESVDLPEDVIFEARHAAYEDTDFHALSLSLARFLSAIGTPNFVDFPITTWSRMGRDEYYDIVRGREWSPRSVTNSIHTESGQEQLVFTPNAAAQIKLAASLGPYHDHSDILKVRSYARFVGPNVYVRLVPVFTLKALRVGFLPTALSELSGLDSRQLQLLQLSSSRGQFRLAQFFGAWRVLDIFSKSLSGDAAHKLRFDLDRVELGNHCPPSSRKRIMSFLEKSPLAPIARVEPLEVVNPTRAQVLMAVEPIEAELNRNGMHSIGPSRAARSVVRRSIHTFANLEWSTIEAELQFVTRSSSFDESEPGYRIVGLTHAHLEKGLSSALGSPGFPHDQHVGQAIDVYNDIGAVVPATCFSPAVEGPGQYSGTDEDEIPLSWCVYRAYRSGEDVIAIDPGLSTSLHLRGDGLGAANNLGIAALAGFVDPLVDETGGIEGFDLKEGTPVARNPTGFISNRDRIMYSWPFGPGIESFRLMKNAVTPTALTFLGATPSEVFDIVESAVSGSDIDDEVIQNVRELGAWFSAASRLQKSPVSSRMSEIASTLTESVVRRSPTSLESFFAASELADRQVHLYWQARHLGSRDIVEGTRLGPAAIRIRNAWEPPPDCRFRTIDQAAKKLKTSRDSFREDYLLPVDGLVSMVAGDGVELIPDLQFDSEIGAHVSSILRMFRARMTGWDGIRWLFSRSELIGGRPVDALGEDSSRILEVADLVSRREARV